MSRSVLLSCLSTNRSKIAGHFPKRENSFTIGVPFARTDTDQDDWENVPESFCQAVLARQPTWTLSIRRHKAEEVLLDTTIFLSQTCRSWRPEVCLFDHESLQVVAYWGMGLRRQSKYIYGMVLRVKTAKAWQCLEALDNGPLDTSLWKLLLLPFDFLTCSHVFHILRAKILETFQFQTVAQLWARPQEWQQTSFTTMWTKICYKTYLSHLGRSNTCSTASTSLSSFTSLALT